MDSSAFAARIRANTNPRSTNRRGAERDAWIVRLAQIGPIWINVLLCLRLFPSRQTAERRLRKLEESKRLRYAGRVAFEGQRRTHIWCNRRFWEGQLRHEVDVMRVFFAYWPHAFALTGSDVNPRWRADMELTIGQVGSGRRYMVEIDEGTEPLHQVRSRLRSYEDCPHTVLMVVPSALRANEVIRLTDNSRIYASRLDSCLAEPWGQHWRNCRGEAGQIERPAA
jgi:hypothetical protein